MKIALLLMALFAARRAPVPPAKELAAKAVICPGPDEPDDMEKCVVRAFKAGRPALIVGTCSRSGRRVRALVRIVDGALVFVMLERCDDQDL